MENDKAIATDTATAEERSPTPFDPTVEHHLQRLHAAAADTNAEQRHAVAAGMLAEGLGERVLVVQPDGNYDVIFVPAAGEESK